MPTTVMSRLRPYTLIASTLNTATVFSSGTDGCAT